MFYFASAFDKNLGAFNIAGLTNATLMFDSSGMSTANYTDTIVDWANFTFSNSGVPASVNMATQAGRTFDTARTGDANFTNAGDARTYLTSTLTWTISGDTVI